MLTFQLRDGLLTYDASETPMGKAQRDDHDARALENHKTLVLGTFGGYREHPDGRKEVLCQWFVRAIDPEYAPPWTPTESHPTPPANLLYRVGGEAQLDWVHNWINATCLHGKCRVYQVASSLIMRSCDRAKERGEDEAVFYYDSACMIEPPRNEDGSPVLNADGSYAAAVPGTPVILSGSRAPDVVAIDSDDSDDEENNTPLIRRKKAAASPASAAKRPAEAGAAPKRYRIRRKAPTSPAAGASQSAAAAGLLDGISGLDDVMGDVMGDLEEIDEADGAQGHAELCGQCGEPGTSTCPVIVCDGGCLQVFHLNLRVTTTV